MLTMIWPVLGLVIVALGISLPLTALLVRLGYRVRALDSAGSAGHFKQLRHVPNIGGIAIFAAVALPLVAGLVALRVVDESAWQRVLPAVVPHLPRLQESWSTAAALLLCLGALHVIGLLDDRRPLGPFPKLIVQLICATVMVSWFDVRLLTLLGPVASTALTVVWIIVITNAINFLDNMDGLAGGVSAIAGSLFMIAALVNHQWFIAATLALLVGGLIGFLVFNFPPAKIFMGDGGSLVVGFLLAVLTARTTFYNEDAPAAALGGGWYGVFMPIVVLAIPLYDFVSVTIIRVFQGHSPFVGDQQHFSHRLVQRGLSKRGAVTVIWALTAITGIGGISLGQLQGWQAILVGIQTGAVLLLLALFEHASRRSGTTAS